MQIKLIDNPDRLRQFLNDPANTGNIVDKGKEYILKPNAVYLGIYEGSLLVGVHEVNQFWHSVIETHPIFEPGFRGQYAIEAHAILIKWLLKNSTFTSIVTMVSDSARYGAISALAVGADRVGHLDDAYFSNGNLTGVTLYQLTRKRCEEIYGVDI